MFNSVNSQTEVEVLQNESRVSGDKRDQLDYDRLFDSNDPYLSMLGLPGKRSDNRKTYNDSE